MTLLDLSAAFHTTDHTILLRRLGNWFGVSAKASYLPGRSQRIKLGVPQVSVLGPLQLPVLQI